MTKIAGVELTTLQNQVLALVFNVWAWILSFLPHALRRPPPRLPPGTPRCVVVAGPGGLDQLQVVELQDGKCSVGYNVTEFPPPYAEDPGSNLEKVSDQTLCIVAVSHFSVNYADVCIRWGLYESALRYVGWPICPGFDFSGRILAAGKESGFKAGDEVFGFTLFGAYSSRLLVPARQIRLIPRVPTGSGSGTAAIAHEKIAGVPAVAATALHAISLTGAWPQPISTSVKACLIHSAAGGVGSMLVQMARLQGFNPIVAVVGSSHKVEYCKSLGATHVIDKSTQDLWQTARGISPEGFVAVFDANGVETIGNSYDHLCRCGRLITYGFHSNIPKAESFLSPMQWIKMIVRLASMPKFEAMPLVLDSKGVLGFNLSFFAEEHTMIKQYMEQIIAWLETGAVSAAEVAVFDLEDIGKAHELIQSGSSVGKIVCRVR